MPLFLALSDTIPNGLTQAYSADNRKVYLKK
jgi:hypothetical protein